MRWWLGLLLVAVGYRLLTSPPTAEFWSPWFVAGHLTGASGALLPLVAFSGGVALTAVVGRRGLVPAVKVGLVVGVIAYALGAYVAPVLQYHGVRSQRPAELATHLPFGPQTPQGLLRNRDTVRASPPVQYSLSVEQPRSTPPNYLTFLVHSAFAISAFAPLSSLMGWLVGVLTQGLRSPRRRNVRWAAGLGSAVVFLVAVGVGSVWVRGSPSVSGLGAAWLPLGLPILEALVLGLLVMHRKSLHDGPPSSV